MSERPAATVLYLRWSFDNLISNSILNTILSENNIYIIEPKKNILRHGLMLLWFKDFTHSQSFSLFREV